MTVVIVSVSVTLVIHSMNSMSFRSLTLNMSRWCGTKVVTSSVQIGSCVE